MKPEVWNATYWIILLFVSLNAVAKSFIQEEGRMIYYFFTCKPHHIILAKLVYSFLYIFILAIISLIIYIALLGNPVINMSMFILNMFLGSLGISSVFTMVSAISFRTANKMVMMAVLGFPVMIPVLMLTINNSLRILEGYLLIQIQGNIITLLSTDVIIIALTFTLFPFTWKS